MRRIRPRARPEAARRGAIGAARIIDPAGLGLGRILWRRKLLILACVVVVLGRTAAYVAGLEPSFEAATLVVVSDREASLDLPLGGSAQDPQSEEQSLEGQLRLIESRTMAEQLVDRLNLQFRAEFNPRLPPDGAGAADGHRLARLVPAPLLDQLPQAWADTLGIASPGDYSTDQERAARLRDHVVEAVMARIHAELARPTTLILKFISADPELAAAGANALGELALEDRLRSRQQAWGRERERLEGEIKRLLASISATEKAIEELHATAAATPDRPSEQDLLDLTGELAFWRSEGAKIEARLSRIQGSLEGDASVDQAALLLGSTLLGELQARKLELERELKQLSQAHGEQDPQVVNLRATLTTLNELKRLEIEQSAEQLEKEVEIIRSRETALEAKIEGLEGQPAEGYAANDLATLERQAEADRELLQSYIERAEQREPPQQVQQLDARVVAPAVVPTAPAYPRLALIYGGALGSALVLGGLLALGLEVLPRMRRGHFPDRRHAQAPSP